MCEVISVWSTLGKLAVGLIYDVDKLLLGVIAESCKKHVGEAIVTVENEHYLVLFCSHLTYNVVLMLDILLIVRRLLE